jgi:alpha-tubulin suppressor-like RCC1 family protein
VLRGGERWCWGDNTYAELAAVPAWDGGGTISPCGVTDCRPTPIKVGLPAKVTHVAPGMVFTCAVVGSGDVYCWGSNDTYELGHTVNLSGDITCYDPGFNACNPMPHPVAFANGQKAVSISAGASFACAVLADTTVACWGANQYTTLGTSQIPQGSPVPLPVENVGPGVVQVAAGQHAACAVKGDGTVWCWGANYYGELGHDPATDAPCVVPFQDTRCSLPMPVTDFEHNRVVSGGAVSAGNACACYRSFTSDKAVWCWGTNAWGELGASFPTNDAGHPFPVQTGLQGQVGVSGISDNLCANSEEGGVSCWGEATLGGLGEAGTALAQTCAGGVSCVPHAVPIVGLPAVRQVTAGVYFAVALADDHSVWTWGDNWRGQCGRQPMPDGGNVLPPGRVEGLP